MIVELGNLKLILMYYKVKIVFMNNYLNICNIYRFYIELYYYEFD